MSKIFFQLYDDIDTEDVEGQEFFDPNQACVHAKSQALHLIGEIVKETGHLALSPQDRRWGLYGRGFEHGLVWRVVTFDQPLTAEQHGQASYPHSGRVSAASRPAHRDTLP